MVISMKDIIKRYKEECEIVSKVASKIYQLGTTILIILFVLISLILNDIFKILISIPILLLISYILFMLCSKIYDKELETKAKKVAKLDKHTKRMEFESVIDEYQKSWISNYVRKNKLRKLSKLSIVIDEIQKEIDRKSINKYIEILIIPAVFSFVIDIAKSNSINESAVLFVRYIICVGVTMSSVYCINNLNIYNVFNKYIGLERLKQLLIYIAIKKGRN